MKLSEVKFSSKSMVDDFGRVFFYNNKVYRAIQSERVMYCKELLASKLFEELRSNGLIPETKASDRVLEGYNLVLKHEKLLEIQQHEWSYEMFKCAALMVIEVNRICNKHGYELKDAHTFNVLFRGTKPVWVDVGSISPIKVKGKWTAFDEFISAFFVPIQFYLQNDYYIVRKLVESNFYKMQTAPFQSFWDSDLQNLLKVKPYYYNFCFRRKVIKTTLNFDSKLSRFSRRFNKYYHKIFKRPVLLFEYSKVQKSVEDIEDYINKSQVVRCKSEWDNYHKNNYEANGEVSVSNRFNRLVELINIHCGDANSAIDLAGNQGFFSNLLSDESDFTRVILSDYDANAVDSAFNFFSSKPNNYVSTVLLNFMFTIGLGETVSRLKSDVAIALAVTHHLILTQQFSIQTVFERLSGFSEKYVVVEFMPLGLWSIHTRAGKDVPEWYTQEWFELNFKKYFTLLHVEQLEENRIVYIGSK